MCCVNLEHLQSHGNHMGISEFSWLRNCLSENAEVGDVEKGDES